MECVKKIALLVASKTEIVAECFHRKLVNTVLLFPQNVVNRSFTVHIPWENKEDKFCIQC